MRFIKKVPLYYWSGGLAIIIVLLFIAMALAAPILAPVDEPGASGALHAVPIAENRLPQAPSQEYRLGTVPLPSSLNQLDIFYTLVWGSRSALLFGFVATLIISLFGSLIGGICSYMGGAAGQVILRVTDAFLAFPVIAGIVLFGQLLFPITAEVTPNSFTEFMIRSGIDNVMLALVGLGWMPYTRVIYTDLERVRRSDFVVAAQSTGARPGRIILRHLIPNSISNVIVLATRDVSGLVLLQATFTFLGLGGSSSWGRLLAVGRNWILGLGGNPLQYWWVFLPITAALILFGIGWNLLGDFLNELLNPRLRFTVPD